MSYFSRLTDIVTCNLTEILQGDDDPVKALQQIIEEMNEGLAGAERSVRTAMSSVDRLDRELETQQAQADRWQETARRELTVGREDGARKALMLKKEVEDVIAGLEQQHQAAIATRDHLSTTLRALHARLAEAQRKLTEHQSANAAAQTASVTARGVPWSPGASTAQDRSRQVEDELAALKRELGRN